MDGHNRGLYLYEALNARVLGVSMDDVITNKFFAKEFWLDFPLVSNRLKGNDLQKYSFSKISL
jgi:peroxiredoxin